MFKRRLITLFNFSIKSLIGVVFVITTLMPGKAVADPASNRPVSLPVTEWTLEVRSPVLSAEQLEHDAEPPSDRHFADLVGKLRSRGLSVTLTPLPGDGKADSRHVKAKAAGKHGLDDFRRILHTVMKPEINLMGGVTEMEIESDDAERQTLDIVLESNPSTGYAWHLLSGGAFIESESTTYQMHTLGHGVPQRQILRLKRGINGIGPIRLAHKRRWEQVPAAFRLTHRLSSLPEKLDLSDPSAPAEPAPPRTQPYVNDSVFPVLEGGRGLPAQWDWRSQGVVTPVRNQASCGSCWAFGTVGIMESALWIGGVANQNLSEQYLVSCNKDGWSCDGGWTAHKYHYDTLGTSQTIVGAVSEADKPYTAANGSCTAISNHPYKLNGWQFVTGSELTVPTVDQIKNAIYAFGPITAGVCVGSAFESYQAGTVFATNETVGCGGYTNHQIILVGWDDPGQYWILRNSWGTGWGESGYMRIKWNTSRVGEGTSWVTVSNTPPDTTSPTVTITSPTSNPTYNTGSSPLSIEGTASDNVGVTQVTWSNDRGGSGTCSGTTSWSASGIGLYNGQNVITVTARDASGYTGTDTLTVTVTCSYAINPANQNFSYSGGSGNVSVITPNGCSWDSISNANWIIINSNRGGFASDPANPSSFKNPNFPQSPESNGGETLVRQTAAIPGGVRQGIDVVLANLKANAKLHAPDDILSDFINGKNETAVIVLIQPTAAATALAGQAKLSGQVPSEFTGRGAPAYYNLQDESIKGQLSTTVTETVQRFIAQVGEAGVKVTQRFSYQFGFAALVTPEALERIVNLPDAVAIQKDSILEAHLAQGIPLMNAAAVRSSYGGAGVSIAICDTGIDTSHPRLGGGGFPNAKVIGGYDTGDNDADPRPSSTSGQAHGTACAGIAAGNTGTVGDYIGGVAPDAKLYAIKISYGNTGSAYESAMIAGWEWAISHENDDPNNPIMIISTSFGGGRYFSTCDTASPAMTTAAANAVAAGITIFASSGNDGYCDSMGWPACISYVNSVGAVYDASFGAYYPCVSSASCAVKYSFGGCSTGYYAIDQSAANKVTSYSNSASFLTLYAPSNQAYTTDIVGAGGYASGDYYSGFGGTSAACPYAAGAAAVLQHAAKARTGSFMTPAQVKSYLVNNGDSVTDGKVAVTKPRINLGNAINALPDSGNGTVIYAVAANSGGARTGTMTIAGNTFTVTQDAAPCMYALNSAGQSFNFSGGAGNVTVTSASHCAWTAASNAAWITITSGSPGAGNGTVVYSVAANPGKDQRVGTMTIAGRTFTVTQDGAPCIYILNPTSQSFTAWRGSGSVGVTVPGGCAWNAASDAFWITVTSGGTGIGNGTVSYSVAGNNGTASRSGTITVGGQTFTVTQDAPIPITCSGSPARIARTGVSYGTLQQAYDAALNNDAIQVQAVVLIGNLTVNRNISATLAGGYTCDFGTDTGLYTTLKGAVTTLAGGGALTISNMNVKPNVQAPVVTTGAVTNNAPASATLNGTVNPRYALTTYYFEWGMTTGYGTRNPLLSASAGKGAADVAVSAGLTGLTPNTTYHYRLVAQNSEGTTNGLDQTFTTPCVFALSPTTAVVTSSGAGYSATVTANGGCSWTAVSNAAWITVDSGTPGSGNGTVNYTVAANPNKDPRSGTLTIAGQTLTVQQAGSPCSYSLASTTQSFGNWGGTGSVGVTATGGCGWSSQSNAPWITITSGASGVGSGTVNYSVAANSGTARTGTMMIGGSTFTVTQAAGPLSCVGSPVRNLNTLVTYATLQSAYDAAANGHTLQVQGVPITGNLTVNRNITVTLEGGYTCDFGTYAGINTPLTGSIRTMPGGGTLIIKNFQLQ